MEQVDAVVKKLRIVWAALLVSVVVYLAAAELVMLERPSDPRMMRYALIALTIAVVATAVELRLRWVRPFEDEARSGRLTGQGGLSTEQTALLERWNRGQTVSLVLCEVVALYGVVLRFMGGTRWEAGPFYAVAVLLMVVWTPRRPG